ncbi:MAG TPA: ACT domain-containing protein [Bacteroidia bacterium]|nr:ACT domain-containing protein [Bacteroidia bacterium]
MNNTYTIHVLGNNEPNLLVRIALVCNRRRVHIKNLNVAEFINKKQYSYTMIVETTSIWAERIAKQLEKQIDVHSVNYFAHVPMTVNRSAQAASTYFE